MNNLIKDIKSALPEKEVPENFDILVENALNPEFSKEEPEIHKSRKAYIFLILAVIFVIILILEKM